MDEDFYIEKENPLKIAFYLIIMCGLIIGGIYVYMTYKNNDNIKLKNVTIELGDKLSKDINTYATGNNLNTYFLDVTSVSVDENGLTNSTGEYSYKIKKNGEIKKGKIFVKDTTKPTFELNDLIVGVNEEFSPNDYLASCTDLSMPCLVRFKKAKDLELNKSEGTYKTTIIISDNAGNEVVKEVTLTVKGENTLLNKKTSDLEFNHLSENDSNWDKTYTLKLEKALNEESVEYTNAINSISTKEYLFDKKIIDKKILVIYNKYNYVIGFSIKINFEDNSTIYVNNDNAKEVVNETEE